MKLVIVGVMILATVITRFLPFFLFPAGKKTPEFVVYLGTTLPYATIGLLVVYCLKGISVMSYPFALPELLSVLLIVILHYRRGNSLISIGAGTVCYMLLIHLF